MLTTILAVFIFCFVLERILPGWPLPQVRTWPLRVLLINGVQLGVILLAGVSREHWLSSASVFHLSQHVSPAAGGLITYFIAIKSNRPGSNLFFDVEIISSPTHLVLSSHKALFKRVG